MQSLIPIIPLTYSKTNTVSETQGGVIVLGNFDGIHLGHKELMKHAQSVRHTISPDAPLFLVTFDPHPRAFFGGGEPFLLQNDQQKAMVAGEYGLDGMVQLPFQDMVSLSPETFMLDVLSRCLGVCHVVVGDDFQFGAERSGGIDDLRTCGAFEVSIMPQFCPDLSSLGNGRSFKECSSTTIRQCLKSGDIKRAHLLLGRPFQIMGMVNKGRQLGRQLGFPTLNLSMGAYQRPCYGVYAVMVHLDGGLYKGVANIGVRPTIDGVAEMLEVHLFDYTGDAYDKQVLVDFIQFIRPEQKFNGLQQLKQQIALDSGQAWQILQYSESNII